MPCLRLDKDQSIHDHTIKEMLDDWYECKSKLKSGEISHEEYTNWKLKYPEKSTLYLIANHLKNLQKNSQIINNDIKNSTECKKHP